MNGFLEEIEAARGLAAVAQIGLGFTGFIAIVVALSGDPRAWAPIDRLRVVMMLSNSLATMFFALLPFALVHVGMSPEMTFRLANGLLAAFLIVSASYVFSRRERRDLVPHGIVARRIVTLTTSLRAIVVVLGAANAYGAFGTATIGIFFFALMWLLAECGFLLVRLLFVRP
jgi:hypothetical protein